MSVQKSHGRPYPLVSPPDELPAGVPAPSVPVERHQDGRVATSAAAKELGKRGGYAKARRKADLAAWGARLGLGRMMEQFRTDETLGKFVAEAESWHTATCEATARDVGGGQLSPGVVSILRTAAWERLFSAALFDAGTRGVFAWEVTERDAAGKPKFGGLRTDLILVGQRLGDSSRQNLLAAHELAAREAAARPRAPVDPLARWRQPKVEEFEPR